MRSASRSWTDAMEESSRLVRVRVRVRDRDRGRGRVRGRGRGEPTSPGRRGAVAR